VSLFGNREGTVFGTKIGTQWPDDGGGASFSGILQDYVAAGGAAPAACWSMSHRLSSTYTGALVRVRNATTAVQTDIGYDAVTNMIDVAALSAALSGANGFVVTVYDQSGNGRDVTNATTSNQPKIWDSATGHQVVSSLPVTVHTASHYLSRGDTCGLTGAQGITLFSWYQHTALAADCTPFAVGGAGAGTTWRVWARAVDSTYAIGHSSGDALSRNFSPLVSITEAGYTVAKRAASSNVTAAVFRRNGTVLTQFDADSSTLTLGATGTALGANLNTFGFRFVGNFSTMILIGEDAAAGPLAALEAFGEGLNALAGL